MPNRTTEQIVFSPAYIEALGKSVETIRIPFYTIDVYPHRVLLVKAAGSRTELTDRDIAEIFALFKAKGYTKFQVVGTGDPKTRVISYEK